VTPLTSGRATRVLAELDSRFRGQLLAEIYSPDLAEVARSICLPSGTERA
jgi:hypothetical protein